MDKYPGSAKLPARDERKYEKVDFRKVGIQYALKESQVLKNSFQIRVTNSYSNRYTTHLVRIKNVPVQKAKTTCTRIVIIILR